MTPAEAERIAAILRKLCETCKGTGLVSVYANGDKDELPDKEPCDEEIHNRIPEATAAIAEMLQEARIDELSIIVKPDGGDHQRYIQGQLH